MQGRSLLIRADGSPTLGMGHISRCVALAQIFAGHEIAVYFACQAARPEVRAVIDSAGFQVVDIDAPPHDAQGEALAIAKLVTQHDVQWLVIDHPEFTIEQEKLIQKNCSSKTIIIDGQFSNHQCDVLINPNAFATIENCRDTVPPKCQVLAGYQYFMLHDNYLQNTVLTRHRQEEVDDRCRILITLGGSDPDNCTLKICQTVAIANFGNHKPVFDVVVGIANRHRPSIIDFLQSVDSDQFVVHDAPDDLVELLQVCTLCVSAGGITLGEAAYLGKPIIGVAILENQHRTIDALSNIGALQKAGISDIASQCKKLLDNLEQRQKLSLRASALVDGLGKQRIANCIWNNSVREG
jgi:UDP-2,4-diacetamido-2,4,6-trideoxy-beta-L-altropyranose hydrolase